jgi:hypothetical protein
MNINLLKEIPIKEYLTGFDCHPTKDKTYYGMYHSPFREDRNPSMKVDYNKNLWYDFGANEGGSIIDLVMKMEKCTLPEAIFKLEKCSNITDYSDSYNRNYPSQSVKQIPLIRIDKVQPLVNPALIHYLCTRKINIDTAKRHCPEVYYSFNDRQYYAIGFKNNSGGYELRNKYFKGCSSKDITSIITNSRSCMIFEGFMDYLSYLTFYNLKHTEQNIIVLNSISNLQKANKLITSFEEVSAFFDNDKAGKNALSDIKPICRTLYDKSGLYLPYKDFNEYLCRE